MKKLLLLTLIAVVYTSCGSTKAIVKNPKDLKILYLTSPKPGRYHRYLDQEKSIKKIVSEYIGATIDTNWDAKTYTNPNLAKNYDFIIMNFCIQADKNPDTAIAKNLSKIIKNGKNALVLHCTLHSFRFAKDKTWNKTLGVTSLYHDKQYAFPLKKVSKKHPIVRNIRNDWKTPKEELYYIKRQETGVYPLHVAFSKSKKTWHPINWFYKYGKGTIIGSSLGHNNEIYTTEPFKKYIANSILWGTGNKIEYISKK